MTTKISKREYWKNEHSTNWEIAMAALRRMADGTSTDKHSDWMKYKDHMKKSNRAHGYMMTSK